MQSRTVKADILLLLTAMIWGFAFVAQRVGMEHVGPFVFNGVRFALGSLSLLPLLVMNQRRGALQPMPSWRAVLLGSGVTGIALFMGVSLQQIGLKYTTAGKAGFITGLYVVFVPIFGILLKQATAFSNWLGAVLAVIGLYLLSVTEQFTIAKGDLFEIAGAVAWAGHIHIIARASRKIHPLILSFMQFLICAIFSLFTAILFEEFVLHDIYQAGIPILYGGLLSVGVAYTLQVVAQRDAHPAHAAILMSLEAVFAVIGGWLLLHERLSPRGFVGCALMLAGMLLSQFNLDASRLKKWIGLR